MGDRAGRTGGRPAGMAVVPRAACEAAEPQPVARVLAQRVDQIVLVGMLVGIDDVAALVGLAGADAAMIGFGWLQERYEPPGGSLGPFWLGCLAGAVPWVAIAVYCAGPGADLHPPEFVYVIFASLFVAFNCFAVNQWLQYRRVGPWRD